MNGFLCILMASVLLSAHVSANKRFTRVINGEPVIGRSTGYDAVKYITAIGTLHGAENSDTWFSESKHNFGALFCGGALITPIIVQTACHCLSFKQQPDSEGKLLPARVKHIWEYIIKVYVGVNKEFGGKWSMANVDPIIAKKFVVHEACTWLPKGTQEIISHDYGWIVVDPNWDPDGELSRRVNYAPVYTEEEMENNWNYLNGRHAVCLVVGFGQSEEGVNDENKKMRYGWLVLLSRYQCIWQTLFGLPNLELITWACLVPFSEPNRKPASGDSGGPVSCNNQYFAVHLGSVPVQNKEELGIKNFMTFESALYWAQYQNTVRFRRKFIRMMEEYGEIVDAVALRRFDPYASSVQTFISEVHQISISSGRQYSCSYSIAFIVIINLINSARV